MQVIPCDCSLVYLYCVNRGLEIWRIENFQPVPVPQSSHGKFFTGDSYVILKTTASKSGGLHRDVHYWLGKDTSQDEAGAAAIKTVELDAALGGCAVQYREVQGIETEKFLSYFKPCIMPQEGGMASGFKHNEAEEYKIRLYVCRGKHVVRVPFARSSLNHDDIFILDTQNKIFQFNGSKSSIQERGKALEVVQHIRDANHHGKCDVASIEDGKLMADVESGEFWGFFGGFAPLPRKTANEVNKASDSDGHETVLYRVEKGQAEPIETKSITKELLDSDNCYILDCGPGVFVWMGRNTTLDARKRASKAAEELIRSLDHPMSHIIRITEGSETVGFKSKFESWPQSAQIAKPEEGRGKVAALLKRQGIDVKGLVKSAPAKEEELEPHIDCTGHLQVWRVNGNAKTLLSASDQAKFYSGDCYIFLYNYHGQDKEEHLIGTWFGKQSVEDERASALTIMSKMVESMKFLPSQARIYEGRETIQFLSIFQSFITFKGGLSEGYKKSIAEKEIPDDTYTEDSLALFRVQGSGPENMQSIQVEPVASSLNSSYCYILHHGSTIFTWSGNLTSPDDQELMERQLDILKPELPCRALKEGVEIDQFWELLGEKLEYGNQKIMRDSESDPHLFSCSFPNGRITTLRCKVYIFVQATEVFNFTQDDLTTEDIYIIDCRTNIYVWVGKQVEPKTKLKALNFGEKFLERDILLEKLSLEAAIYVVMEGSEPLFFTRFFTWDSTKSMMHGNSFQRKLAIVKHGQTPIFDKPKRRVPIFGGRSGISSGDNSQRSRSMTFSPERTRVRGRSPAFSALAANFENPNTRNLSTPPPMVGKLYPKSSVTPEPSRLAPKAFAIAALTASFEKAQLELNIPKSPDPKEPTAKVSSTNSESGKDDEGMVISQTEESSLDDAKESVVEDDAGLPTFPYDRITTTSTDPITDIDVTKREAYLSLAEFKEKFDMPKDEFYKLPRWKQDKLKKDIQLF
ncbi:hypothetical protein V2J09_010293 [Rumex salicifolius]